MNHEKPHRRGRLKIYLGYAAGVGKTYQMLLEIRELKRQGDDAVVGYFEPHGRQATIVLTEGLEVMPRKKLEYRGTVFEEMDTEAILQRHPKTCAVDEFPHTNVPGSPRTKRWEDVQVLLEAGINVITTMNVQHIESLNDQVRRLAGVRVRETIPDWVVQQADEVVMIDLPPEALLNRLRRGVVYPSEKAQRAMENFFRESTLRVLRELTLRQTAHEVDIRSGLMEGEVVPQWPLRSGQQAARRDGVQERILIFVTPEISTDMLIRRGRRVADHLKAECFAVAVVQDNGSGAPEQRQALDKHLNFARALHIETHTLEGKDVAQTLVDFARSRQITQIFVLRPQRKFAQRFLERDIVQDIVRQARDMQVTIVAERQQPN